MHILTWALTNATNKFHSVRINNNTYWMLQPESQKLHCNKPKPINDNHWWQHRIRRELTRGLSASQDSTLTTQQLIDIVNLHFWALHYATNDQLLPITPHYSDILQVLHDNPTIFETQHERWKLSSDAAPPSDSDTASESDTTLD